MSLSYIEKWENAFKRRLQVAEQTANNEKQRADAAVEILKEIVDNYNIKLSQETIDRIS